MILRIELASRLVFSTVQQRITQDTIDQLLELDWSPEAAMLSNSIAAERAPTVLGCE